MTNAEDSILKRMKGVVPNEMLVPHRFALTTVRSASKYFYGSTLNDINFSDTKLSFTKGVIKVELSP